MNQNILLPTFYRADLFRIILRSWSNLMFSKLEMNFRTSVFYLLFISVSSLGVNGENGTSNNEAVNCTGENLSNTTKSGNVIRKSDLAELVNLKDQYVVKNTIEDFEIHWAPYFQPDLTKVNKQASAHRQAAEIRCQKWRYIFDTLTDSYVIKRLESELKKANISCTTFCNDISEAYYQLSCNTSIFHGFVSTDNPLIVKSVQVFMKSVSDLKLNPNDPEETVQIPKSLYIKLLCKDAQVALMKHHHKDQMDRLKEAYKTKVRQARHSSEYDVDSELSTEFE